MDFGGSYEMVKVQKIGILVLLFFFFLCIIIYQYENLSVKLKKGDKYEKKSYCYITIYYF